MSGAYTHIKAIATAIAADASILAHCLANYQRGALVRIDDFAAAPITDDDAPFIVVAKVPQQELGQVADADEWKIQILVGVAMSADAQVPAITTVRSESANGLEQIGDAEKAEDLLALALAVVRALTLSDDTGLHSITEDSDGWTTFPLQTAEAEIVLRRYRTMEE